MRKRSRPVQTLNRASGPKWEKNGPKKGSWPHQNNGTIAIFGPYFSHFLPFSPLFSVGPKSIFRPFSAIWGLYRASLRSYSLFDIVLSRHRVNGVGRGGGQTVLNQILTRFHGVRLKSGQRPVEIQLKSGQNLLKSCVFRGTRRTPTGLKEYNPVKIG